MASFCARLEVFLSIPKSARVGASFFGGSILVLPKESLPFKTVPFALSVAFSISPSCLSDSISMVCACSGNYP